MRTLYVRNVPDDVAARLDELASREGRSVDAIVVDQLSSLARWTRNAEIFDARHSLGVSAEETVRMLDEGRSGR